MVDCRSGFHPWGPGLVAAGSDGSDAVVWAFKALDAIAKNKAIVVLPSRWKVLWGAGRISPSLGMYLDQKGYEAAQKD